MTGDASTLTLSYFHAVLSKAFLPLARLNLILLHYSDDWNKIVNKGETVTQEIPHKGWSLVTGFQNDGKGGGKYTVGVNGVEMSALPKVDLRAASYPRFCKSEEEKIYSEFKR